MGFGGADALTGGGSSMEPRGALWDNHGLARHRPPALESPMKTLCLVLATLASGFLPADTQKTAPAPATKESREAKTQDLQRFLAALGMPRSNSEAARKQITAASKDPKLAAFPPAYWKDYLDSASPETFEKLLLPIYDKAYSHEDIKAFLKLFASPEFKQVLDRQPEGMRLLTEKNPAMLRGKAFEAFSAHMTEVGRKLQEKHGVKAGEAKK